MAATKTAASTASKKRASRNDTPNTPDVSESRIARMKVGELRRELEDRGVKGKADLKKPDLVKKLIKAEVKASRTSKTGGKNPTSRNDTPDTPEVSESRIARMRASDLRTQLTKLGVKGAADMKKAELVERYVKARLKLTKGGSTPRKSVASSPKKSASDSKTASGTTKSATSGSKKSATSGSKKSAVSGSKTSATSGSKKSAASASTSGSKKSVAAGSTSGSKKSAASKADSGSKSAAPKSAGASKGAAGSKGAAASPSGGKRTGKKASKSLDYSQEIRSTTDKPERDGRSLITTDHEVIRQWAKARRAVPSTVAGTQHDGHLGVLRFDFPGYSNDDRLVEVSWAEWFEAFDKRRLNFIYQERRSGGERSNFFQLDNPDE